MIPNQWYVILSSKEVKKNRVLGVRRLGRNMVVWRDSKGIPGVALDKCPHRGIKLSCGKIHHDHLQCPFHGFEYDQTGKCKFIPANGKATPVPGHIMASAYPVRESNGFIYLWWDDVMAGTTQRVDDVVRTTRQTTPSGILPWFTDLYDSLVWAAMTDHWKAHYSRVIENQLDVVHVPFIHRTTIGRGIGPVVNGPYTKVFDTGLSFWPGNEQDHGQTPLRPDQMPEPSKKDTFLTFLFPNLWQNHIMDSLRIVVAFVPVDENNTILYLRTYQKMVKIPVLKEIYFLITNLFNLIVLHQDRRVVETHQPQATQLKMNENLISGDFPIILYRKRREELKKLNVE